MKFKLQTKIQLEKTMRDLDFEASEYEWGERRIRIFNGTYRHDRR